MSAPSNPPRGRLTGWGGHSAQGWARRSEDLVSLSRGAVLSRGLGRSYGDSALPPPGVDEIVCTTLGDRILGFSPETGLLSAEAGLSLQTLVWTLLPRGFFPPVTPGTQFVTLGGMVAADVHGKNHHVAGCIGQHVRRLRMRLADGSVVDCGPDRAPELFWATVGGMGLTGHILEVDLAMERVPSPWIYAETLKIADIDAFEAALRESAAHWPMTVGWIDCLQRGSGLGRGILHRGRWALAGEAPTQPPRPRPRIDVPFMFPSVALSRPVVRVFNAVLYHRQRRARVAGIVHPESCFYPLDRIGHWNRIYGRRGFTQYQCVLPRQAGPGAARRFLEVLTARGGASFLCVIKDCGPEGQGVLSFPREGTSIALDIPIRDDTPTLIAALDEATIALGGRVYLAKDSLTTAENFARMDPRIPAFLRARCRFDPRGRIASAQSVRLFGGVHPPMRALAGGAGGEVECGAAAGPQLPRGAVHDDDAAAILPAVRESS